MNVDAQLYEIDSLDKEIARLRKTVAGHVKRRKALMKEIVDYMKESDQESLEFNGTVYKLDEKVRRTRKKEADRKRDVLAVLEEHLDGDTDKIYADLVESFKGPEKVEMQLAVPKTK